MDRKPAVAERAPPSEAVRALPAWAIWFALNGATLLVLAGRATGIASRPPTSSQVCVAAIAVAVLSLVPRLLIDAAGRTRSPAGRTAGVVLTVLPLLVLTCAAALDRLPFAAACAATLAVLQTALLHGKRPPVLWDGDAARTAGTALSLSSPGPPAESGPSLRTAPATDHEAESFSAEGGGQWMRRSSNALGGDCLHGTAIAEFAAGEKQSALHIAFCPPFAFAPRFVCDIIGNAGVRFKLPAVYSYGARIELKRGGNCQAAARVEVRFSATVSANVADAA